MRRSAQERRVDDKKALNRSAAVKHDIAKQIFFAGNFA